MTTPTFPLAGLELLAALERNNNTRWFDLHRDDYRALVQAPAIQIVEYVNRKMTPFASEYVNDKKNPLRRPNRDTRFSKDKSPYHTEVAVVFPRQGLPKEEAAGFFFGIGPSGARIVAGVYMPGPDQLKALRAHFAKHHAQFLRVATARPLTTMFGDLQGERLKRVPRGVEPDHPAESLLRMTQFYVDRQLSAKVISGPDFADEIVASFRAATPLVRALDAALGNP